MHTPVFDPWQTAWVYADAVGAPRASAALWQAQRTRRLAALLSAAQRSRLYRERLAGAASSGDPWQTLQRLRPVSKRELMQRFDDWVTDPELSLPALRRFLDGGARSGEPWLDRYLVWESSGSSGEPAVFVQDARCLAVFDALQAARGPVSLVGPLAPWWQVPQRIALVAATGGAYASVLSFERARALNPWLAATSRSFSMQLAPQELAARLDAYAPTVLATYPSMAWVLSEEQRAGRLRLALQAVWTGGETLTAAVRRTVAERFRAPVHDSYGASECFVIADECRHGRLHANADWVVLEPADEQLRPVPEGEPGHTVLLTNLANHAQPVVRYDLGDRVRIVPGGCDCGSSLPVIEVQGRCDDVLTLADARGHRVHLSPLALTTVLEDDAGVFDFQLQGVGLRALRLAVHEPGAGERAAAALRAFLQTRGLAGTRIAVTEHAGRLPCGASGKRLRVQASPRPGF